MVNRSKGKEWQQHAAHHLCMGEGGAVLQGRARQCCTQAQALSPCRTPRAQPCMHGFVHTCSAGSHTAPFTTLATTLAHHTHKTREPSTQKSPPQSTASLCTHGLCTEPASHAPPRRAPPTTNQPRTPVVT